MRTPIAAPKLGDKVTTYCTGMQVTGEVVEVSPYAFLVEHEPVNWGADTYKATRVVQATELQRQYSGKNWSPAWQPAQ